MTYGDGVFEAAGRLMPIAAVAVVGSGVVLAEVSPVAEADYGVIVTRNAFGLGDPPPPAPSKTPTNAAPAKSTLQLSGISVGPSGKYAWLVVPPNPAGRTNFSYWKLKEGDEQDGVRVLEINESSRSVKVSNASTIEVLDLFKDSPPSTVPVLAPTVPGAVPVPGRPGMPATAAGTGLPRAGLPTPARTLPAGGGGARISSPTVQRIGSSPGGVPSAAAPAPVSLNVGGADTAGRTVPTRPIRTAELEAGPVDVAEQYLRLKVAEQAGEQQGIPMPPTPPM